MNQKIWVIELLSQQNVHFYRFPLSRPTRKTSNHLKPLYVEASFDDCMVDKVLVDSGAMINVLAMSMLKKLGRSKYELLDMKLDMVNFTKKSSKKK